MKRRDYASDVLGPIDAMRASFEVATYGHLDTGVDGTFPLIAISTGGPGLPGTPAERLPTALVTGGVHGYETSGVHGALAFMARHGRDFAGRPNVIVAPCVSPWAYERIQRWNADAVDPNRRRSRSTHPRGWSKFARSSCSVGARTFHRRRRPIRSPAVAPG